MHLCIDMNIAEVESAFFRTFILQLFFAKFSVLYTVFALVILDLISSILGLILSILDLISSILDLISAQHIPALLKCHHIDKKKKLCVEFIATVSLNDCHLNQLVADILVKIL